MSVKPESPQSSDGRTSFDRSSGTVVGPRTAFIDQENCLRARLPRRYTSPSTIETVRTKPLTDLIPSERLARIDFAKLDVEQAEMDVLVSSGPLLEVVLGLELEVHFPKRPAESACFAEVDAYLQGCGFDLYDLDIFRYTRPQWPTPTLCDVRDDDGRPVPAPTVEGQVLTGDALYIRSAWPTEGDRALKLACIFELHRLRDCAIALLERAPDLVPDDVSRLLFKSHDSLHAEDGRPWGPNYHVFEELWRQRPYGYRDPTLAVGRPELLKRSTSHIPGVSRRKEDVPAEED